MVQLSSSSIDSIFLDRLDLDAMADQGDKIRECEFFLNLASVETNRTQFRWLISAYLNAVYSFFETTALYASCAFTDPETGEPIEDAELLERLRAYVGVDQNKNKPYFVKTSGLHPVIAELYEIRKAATHHFPLSIMAEGANLPEDFQLGNLKGKGKPLLALCRKALIVIREFKIDV